MLASPARTVVVLSVIPELSPIDTLPSNPVVPITPNVEIPATNN